ncbi:MAG: PcfB family protein, partial [Firmicutes bacterium]|nr:PcfB family protein [Bacillota bacterium]
MSMEHEHINDKNVALSVRGAKVTARLLAQAMQAFLKKAREPTYKHGKQSLKSLTKQGASLADIEISGDNIGSFKKIARKYNIDYSLKLDKAANPPRCVVFFKAKDSKALESAFKEYS